LLAGRNLSIDMAVISFGRWVRSSLGDLLLNLRKMILGANFTETVIAEDLRIPNGKATIMGWSGRV